MREAIVSFFNYFFIMYTEKLKITKTIKNIVEEKKNCSTIKNEGNEQFLLLYNLITSEAKKINEMFFELKEELKHINDNMKILTEKINELEAKSTDVPSCLLD